MSTSLIIASETGPQGWGLITGVVIGVCTVALALKRAWGYPIQLPSLPAELPFNNFDLSLENLRAVWGLVLEQPEAEKSLVRFPAKTEATDGDSEYNTPPSSDFDFVTDDSDEVFVETETQTEDLILPVVIEAGTQTFPDTSSTSVGVTAYPSLVDASLATGDDLIPTVSCGTATVVFQTSDICTQTSVPVTEVSTQSVSPSTTSSFSQTREEPDFFDQSVQTDEQPVPGVLNWRRVVRTVRRHSFLRKVRFLIGEYLHEFDSLYHR